MRFSLLEKFGLSILIVAWLLYGSHSIGEWLVHVDETVAVAALPAEAPARAAEPAEPEPEVDLPTLLAAADAGAGERVFRKCKSCHTVESGGANKVGPNLWDIVGAATAGVEGFAYSGAFAELGGTWTYEDLDAFLADPKGYAPGTKMSFAGLKKAKDRAAVIAYLRANADNPPPLP